MCPQIGCGISVLLALPSEYCYVLASVSVFGTGSFFKILWDRNPFFVSYSLTNVVYDLSLVSAHPCAHTPPPPLCSDI